MLCFRRVLNLNTGAEHKIVLLRSFLNTWLNRTLGPSSKESLHF